MAIIIKEAENDLELGMSFRLRYEIYCEEIESLKGGDYPEKKEIDEWDKRAFHIIALGAGEILGSLRLLPDSNLKFLMEKEFSLPQDINRSKTLEVSRVVLKPQWRNTDLTLHLLKAAFIFSRQRGYERWCAALIQSFARMLRMRWSWRFEELSRPVLYHNKKVVSAICRLTEDDLCFPPDNSDVIIRL